MSKLLKKQIDDFNLRIEQFRKKKQLIIDKKRQLEEEEKKIQAEEDEFRTKYQPELQYRTEQEEEGTRQHQKTQLLGRDRKLCPDCGANVALHIRTCLCDHKFDFFVDKELASSKKFCPNCHLSVHKKSRLCSSCGYRFRPSHWNHCRKMMLAMLRHRRQGMTFTEIVKVVKEGEHGCSDCKLTPVQRQEIIIELLTDGAIIRNSKNKKYYVSKND